MRRVVMFAVFALVASTATGCIVDNSGGDDGPNDVGRITVNWSFKELATNSILPCPTGFNTAAFYAYPVDSTGSRVGDPIIDLYQCAAGSGTSDYPIGRYEVYLEITNGTNTGLYAQSLSTIVDIVPDDATFTTTIIDDGGFFIFDWELRGQTSGTVLSCAQANTARVDIGVTVAGTTEGTNDTFPCENRTGVTGGLIADTYTVTVAALNTANLSVGTAPSLTNKVIAAPNKVTDLGLIMIPITGQ